MNRTVLQGDVSEKIKEISDNSIDLICTDPPYGYSFMNKDWDKVVISSDVWRECLRVLKPGSFAFVMSAPRQDVLYRVTKNLEDAGFNIGFTSLYWAYASGFPKAMNVSKAVDKRLGFERTEVIGERKRNVKPYNDNDGWNQNNTTGNYEYKKPSSPQAKKLDGAYAGFQPKPAVEVILVCMKPLEQKNYVEQALDNGKGITWFDDCRIPYKNEDDIRSPLNAKGIKNECGNAFHIGKFETNESYQVNNQGRFPANLIVSDGALDVGKRTGNNYRENPSTNNNSYFNRVDQVGARGYDDEGDFSRYFDLDSWEAQFIITPKPSKSEKNEGLATKQNTHPTVKPVSLFKYLVTMGSRPGDMVLDPFMGSGTTAIACEKTARNWIGIEINSEYREIIEARIDKYRKQERLF